MPDTYFLQTKLYFGVQNGKFGSVIKTRKFWPLRWDLVFSTYFTFTCGVINDQVELTGHLTNPIKPVHTWQVCWKPPKSWGWGAVAAPCVLISSNLHSSALADRDRGPGET